MRARSSLARVAIVFTGLAASAALGLVPASCSSSRAPTTATVALEPSIIVPEGIIDQIAVYMLTVYSGLDEDGGVTCTTSTGVITGNLAAATPIYGPVGNAQKDAAACAQGSSRCIIVPALEQSPVPRVFAVTGYSDAAHTNAIAYGCTVATVNGGVKQTTYSVDITMQAIPAKQICGDGVLEPPETCDPGSGGGGAAVVCGSDCQTIEELLSTGSGSPDGGSGSNTIPGSPGDKADPAFLWPTNGPFYAFFSDKSRNAANSEQVSMRELDEYLAPATTLGTVLDSDSIFLPNTPSVFPPAAEAFDHKQPAAVQSGGLTYVAFADDSAGSYSIVLRAMDGQLNAEQSTPCPVGETSSGSGVNQTAPAISISTASGAAVFLIAWQDDSGSIYGRTYTPGALGACGTRGTQQLISTGSNSSHVSLAAIPSGWVAVWQSGGDVILRPIGADGTPSKNTLVLESSGHTASSPSVASIVSGTNIASDQVGALAIVWADQAPGASGPAIYAQRFDASEESIDNAGVAISQSSNEGFPVIAASPALGGSYVVTWIDLGSGNQVRGRFLQGTTGDLTIPSGSGTGYLTNPNDGTPGEFPVTTETGRTRTSPTVAVGGGATGALGYVAFGWADKTADHSGIWARRFPLPTQ